MTDNELPDSGHEGGYGSVSGNTYSRVLIRRTQEYLYEIYDTEPTHEDIARYLGTTAERISEVMTGDAILGLELFKNLADKNRQTFISFLADLARWSRNT